MANLNCLKVVFAERGKTGKWLAEELGESNCAITSGAAIAFSQA